MLNNLDGVNITKKTLVTKKSLANGGIYFHDPSNGISSEVIIYRGNTQIDVISVAYNADDLLKITSTLYFF